MQLNELRITSDAELEEWKKTWDGTVGSVPEEVHRYMHEVVFPEKERYWEEFCRVNWIDIQNENS